MRHRSNKQLGSGMIKGFQHVSITCRNIERSIEFYEKLGLKIIKRIAEVRENGIASAFQLPEAHLTVAYLAPNQASTMFIDLVQWLEPQSTGEPYPALNHVGINRLAFRVLNLDATTASLRERGIVFLSEKPESFGPVSKAL